MAVIPKRHFLYVHERRFHSVPRAMNLQFAEHERGACGSEQGCQGSRFNAVVPKPTPQDSDTTGSCGRVETAAKHDRLSTHPPAEPNL